MLPYIDLPDLGLITAFGVLAMFGAYVGLAAGSRHVDATPWRVHFRNFVRVRRRPTVAT
jgi:hypothetical protein